ncbi:hypothetical protein [Acinetobacter sp. BSP-28]|uniref:hypothetical protein n=1 Tax=Acinetobacter sp. BSP-28 TaxID=3344661 RepID=UPI0037700796
MTTEKELQAQKAERELHKNTQKVLAALKDNPLGLSGNQLTTICRLSIKTVRNVISTRTDITESLGVYTLNQAQVKLAVEQPAAVKPTVAASPTKEIIQKAPELAQKHPTEVKRNLQTELLKLLQENKEGLLGEVITSTLNITDKQLSQAMWLLRKTWNINRTGLPGASHYQLVVGEAVNEVQPEEQPVDAKPETQMVSIPSLEFRKDAVASAAAAATMEIIQKQPEALTHILGIEIHPGVKADSTDTPATLLDEYKSQIQTVVTRKSKLKLEKDQLSELLSDIFGLSKVDWFIEGGNLVGVLMTDEDEVVA